MVRARPDQATVAAHVGSRASSGDRRYAARAPGHRRLADLFRRWADRRSDLPFGPDERAARPRSLGDARLSRPTAARRCQRSRRRRRADGIRAPNRGHGQGLARTDRFVRRHGDLGRAVHARHQGHLRGAGAGRRTGGDGAAAEASADGGQRACRLTPRRSARKVLQ